MKRDDDFLRQLLLGLESSPDWLFVDPEHFGMNAAEEKKHYHIQLLSDVDFLTVVGQGTFRLTAQGHDFLDAIRDEGIWAKTKTGIAGVGGATLGIVKDLAVAYLRQRIAEKTGILL